MHSDKSRSLWISVRLDVVSVICPIIHSPEYLVGGTKLAVGDTICPNIYLTLTAAGIKVEKREDHMTMCELETRAISALRKSYPTIIFTKSMTQCTSLNTRSDKLRSCDNV